MKKALLYGIAVLLAFSGCEQLTENKKASVPQPKLVADTEGLEAAFEDPGVKFIEIQGGIKADTLNLTVAPGDKTISIPGGKETAVGSIELSAGSHVKIMNGSGGTAKSAGGAAAAYSEQNYDEWATLVVWNNFKIPGGATFDLTGKVRLVFHVAEVDGELRADLEDSLLAAGDEAPVITGKGKVQTSKDAEAKKPGLAAADIKTSEEHKALVTISAAGTGIMTKGGIRQFTANRTVTWSVEGMPVEDEYGNEKDTKSANTTITPDGLLTIAADETNITLTVKAASGENTAAETVRVKGWKAIESVNTIFGSVAISGIAYGNGIWVAIGADSSSGFKIAYSVDGEFWMEAGQTTAMNTVANNDKYRRLLNNVIYDGPEGGKKFIAFGNPRIIIYSTNGKTWKDAATTGITKDMESYGGAYGNGSFVAAGFFPESYYNAVISTDGTLWGWAGQADSPISSIYSAANKSFGAAFGNGKFIVPFGDNAAIARTADGADMELAANAEITVGDETIPAKGYPAGFTSAPSFKKVVFAGGQWIVGGGSILAFSSDTESWSPVDVNSLIGTTVSSIASGGGRLAIGGGNGKFAYTSLPASPASQWTAIALNTKTIWTTHIANTYASVAAICFGDNKVIVGGSRGRMAVAYGETLD
jgi:hypothetical protein